MEKISYTKQEMSKTKKGVYKIITALKRDWDFYFQPQNTETRGYAIRLVGGKLKKN